VDAASKQCAECGVTALLRLPLDVPLVQSNDIDELLSVQYAAPALVIVPSRDGTGSNAILRTPPVLFPSHFGTGSFAKHCDEAERAGAQIVVRRNARLEMDVDDEADLRALAREDLRGTETGAWLQRSDLLERLTEPVVCNNALKLAANT
jgi:2-phospho-L-lactate guanylyltransferase